MKERMNIVIVGHVDHGKSTLVGRLLVDTGSLPEGRLEQVKKSCENNSRPFEYAFLLDALVNEQAQGITIDTARIFFKTPKREYIIIDAPGHIEFLKNMISGAARAEAAILLIDAKEGIAENSKRHAYMLSHLDISQVVVAVNKMDLVNYSQEVYEKIKVDYTKFLKEININPVAFIPVTAREGVNLTAISPLTAWYKGETIVELIDGFKNAEEDELKPFRMFVQDVYKFTANGDDRRIIAGTVNSGKLKIGDEVEFLPSGKRSRIKTIESFNGPKKEFVEPGEATGFTLEEQVYVKPTELMYKVGEKSPITSNSFRASIVWLGKQPLVTGKSYKLKIGTQKTPVVVEKIESVLNASILESYSNRNSVERYEIAQCILTASNKISFDLINEIKDTGRLVIVDCYEIAGGGIIIENVVSNGNGHNGHKPEHIDAFKVELNDLVRRYFPNMEINDLLKMDNIYSDNI